MHNIQYFCIFVKSKMVAARNFYSTYKKSEDNGAALCIFMQIIQLFIK